MNAGVFEVLLVLGVISCLANTDGSQYSRVLRGPFSCQENSKLVLCFFLSQ